VSLRFLQPPGAKPSNDNVGSAWFRHFTLTSGLLDPKPLPLQNLSKSWTTARAPSNWSQLGNPL